MSGAPAFCSETNAPYLARCDAAGNRQKLGEHLLHTAAYCRQHLAPIGFAATGELLGLLHDLGKYTPEFQGYLLSSQGCLQEGDAGFLRNAENSRGAIPHAGAGARWLLNDSGLPDPAIRQLLAMAITSHHTGLNDFLTPTGELLFERLLVATPYKLGPIPAIFHRADADVKARIGELCAGAEIPGEFQQYQSQLAATGANLMLQHFHWGMLLKSLYSALIDADRLDAAGRTLEAIPDWRRLSAVFERNLAAMHRDNRPGGLHAIRQQISECCRECGKSLPRGVYRLTVPTGGGKTLASLRFALEHAQRHRLRKIIYIIPFTGIIEQNAAVARNYLDDPAGSTVLEVHCHLLPERKNDREFQKLTENFAAPVIFTTMVQFLLAVFSDESRSNRHLHDFNDALILFDEIQSIPCHMVHLFNAALNFLSTAGRATLVLSSATQPRLDAVDAELGALRLSAAPELVADPVALFMRMKRVDTEYVRDFATRRIDELAAFAAEQVRSHRTVLAVVNTKSHARRLYQEAQKLGLNVRHLSTNMCPAHRKQVLDEIRRHGNAPQPEPLFVVSTSLIEAGVDISFNCVIRMMAGLDSLAQAAGRCNRHGDLTRGKVFLLDNPTGLTRTLPESTKAAVAATRYALDEFDHDPGRFGNDLLHPDLLDCYYRKYYAETMPNHPEDRSRMCYPVSLEPDGGYTTMLELLSVNTSGRQACRQRRQTPPRLTQAMATAGRHFRVFEDFTPDAAVAPFGAGKALIERLFSCDPRRDREYNHLLEAAQPYSVGLSESTRRKLENSGALQTLPTGVLILDPMNYHADFGLDTRDPDADAMEFLCV